MTVLAPDWFLGEDVLIGIFSFIVLFIFSVLSIRGYKVSKNKNFLYLGTGFSLIAIAQLALIVTKGVIYYNTSVTTSIGVLVIEAGVVSSVSVLYGLSFFFYRMLTLTGLYIVYRLPKENKFKGLDLALVLFFIILSAFISGEVFYIFNITALILLIFIVASYREVYRKNGFINTKILIIAFGVLAISHLMYVLSAFDIFFAIANVVELIGYSILLGLIMRILKDGKEKKSYGYNIRHAGHNTRKKR